MRGKTITRTEAKATIAAVHRALAAGYPLEPKLGRDVDGRAQRGAYAVAADELGIARGSPMASRLATIRNHYPDLKIDPAKYKPKESPAPQGAILTRLRRGEATMEDLKRAAGVDERRVRRYVEQIEAEGFNIQRYGDVWTIPKAQALPAGPHDVENMPVLVSRPDNTFCVGASGDQHLGSKYERLDVLNDLYDRFAKAKVQAVYNTGNWIDGEARFNRHELKVHGMEAQCRYLAKHFPQRPGVKTYAVAGDDHEGWYSQREGVDIGRFAERIMREEGRTDWINLGFMEGYVRLVNANTGKSAILAVVHPGGGSAYALSYSIQKIIEGLDGGEKPAVGFYGHYHKLWAGNIRNVWCLQTGTTKDQDAFMRKKKIDAHVGGAIVRMEQDPATGAIIGFEPNMIRYFNQGYYANRWSYSDDVTLPTRGPFLKAEGKTSAINAKRRSSRVKSR